MQNETELGPAAVVAIQIVGLAIVTASLQMIIKTERETARVQCYQRQDPTRGLGWRGPSEFVVDVGLACSKRQVIPLVVGTLEPLVLTLVIVGGVGSA